MRNKNTTHDQMFTKSCNHQLLKKISCLFLYNSNSVFPIDRVSGYSAVQLQNALINAKSWNDWRDKIKNDYNNSTEPFVDELFSNWQD